MIAYLQNDDKLTDRPFATEAAKKLFNDYIADRLKEVDTEKK